MNNIYIDIPTHNLTRCTTKLSALNRKARRLNCPEATLTLGHTFYAPADTPTAATPTAFVEKTTVMLTCPPPIQVRGWQFIARLEHTENGNVFHKISDTEIPHSYRHIEDLHCDHCNNIRKRNDLFLVTDGEVFKQVGSTCVLSFTGDLSAAQVIANAALYTFIDDLIDNKDPDQGPLITVTALDLLATAHAVIKANGRHISEDTVRVGEHTTAHEAFLSLSPTPTGLIRTHPTQGYYEDIYIIYQWIRNHNCTKKNDLFHNLNTLLDNEYITKKQAPLLVQAIPAFKKVTSPQPRQWVGKVGSTKVLKNLRVTRISPFNQRGEQKAFITIKTEEGDILKWCTPEYYQYEEGDALPQLTAYIKKHEQWNGQKQTHITIRS